MKGNGFNSRYRHNGRLPEENEPPADDPEEIKDRMAELRRGLRADAAQIARSAQQATDWKFYVQRFPLVCAGVAFVVGYALVPSKRARGPLLATDEQLERMAKAGQLKVVAEAPSAEQPGLLRKAMFAVGGLALRAALDHVGQTLAVRASPQVNSHQANGRTSHTREY